MKTKRYTPPETVLQRVIEAIEREDNQSHQQAVLTLLSQGPLFTSEALLKELEHSAPDAYLLLRAELLAFLRTLVREQEQGRFSPGISLYETVTFSANLAGGRVACAAQGDIRDLVVLQMVLLLQLVGLENVRLCAAPDCLVATKSPASDLTDSPFVLALVHNRRLFIKTYRREFCSAQCQKRVYMRQRRANERAKRQRRKRAKKGA